MVAATVVLVPAAPLFAPSQNPVFRDSPLLFCLRDAAVDFSIDRIPVLGHGEQLLAARRLN